MDWLPQSMEFNITETIILTENRTKSSEHQRNALPGELVNIVKYSEMRSGLRLLDSFICVMCNNQCS